MDEAPKKPPGTVAEYMARAKEAGHDALGIANDPEAVEAILETVRAERDRLKARVFELEVLATEACDMAAKWLAVVTGDLPAFANWDTKRHAERIAFIRMMLAT